MDPMIKNKPWSEHYHRDGMTNRGQNAILRVAMVSPGVVGWTCYGLFITCPILHASLSLRHMYWMLLVVGLPCACAIPFVICLVTLTDPGTLTKQKPLESVLVGPTLYSDEGQQCVPISTSAPIHPTPSPALVFAEVPGMHNKMCNVCGALRINEETGTDCEAHHCRNCDHCVAEFDHHCGFLNVCVGRGNRVRVKVCSMAYLLLILCERMVVGIFCGPTCDSCNRIGFTLRVFSCGTF
jgi:hypothetical protein